MPPEKFEIVTDEPDQPHVRRQDSMPKAEIVPLLLMPPAKEPSLTSPRMRRSRRKIPLSVPLIVPSCRC